MLNVLLVSWGSAPPPTLVSVKESKPLAPLPSGPRAMVTVSGFSAWAGSSAIALHSRVATWAAWLEKVSFGVAVVAPDRVTPVLIPLMALPGTRDRLQSPVVTFVPLMERGTSITSPATNSRPRVTVNLRLFPSVRVVAEPTFARLTMVGSLSLMVY